MNRRALDIARRELGSTESPAGSNRTKYGKWLGLDGQPWCMSFVQWCFNQAGAPLPCRTGSCSALLRWYRANQPERVVPDPMPGDIVIYRFGHTGIVESASGSDVTAIEGNTSPGQGGSQDNGGGVFRRTRKRSPCPPGPGRSWRRRRPWASPTARIPCSSFPATRRPSWPNGPRRIEGRRRGRGSIPRPLILCCAQRYQRFVTTAARSKRLHSSRCPQRSQKF